MARVLISWIILIATCIVFLEIYSGVLYAAPRDVIFGPRTQGNRIPWWGRKYDSITSQHLYVQSDIDTYGQITSFAWQNYLLIEDPEGTYYNVRIYMGHTTRSTLGTVLADNFTGPRTLVFSRASFTTGGATDDWNEIPLDTPFTYNNMDNLLIEVRWNGDDDHSVLVWCGYWTDHGARAYAFTDTATTGSIDADYVYRIKLHFEDAIQPTSTPTISHTPTPFRTPTITPTPHALPVTNSFSCTILVFLSVPILLIGSQLRKFQ